jgi:DNA-binding response OmpR family regulator
MTKKAKKILIIEDEKPMAKALKLKLEKNGFEVDIAPDGKEALKKLKGEKYHLALMDLVMPHMDGFTLLKELQDKKIKTPIIVTSNLSQKEDMEKAKSYGVKDFLVKSDTPITDIVKKVQENT